MKLKRCFLFVICGMFLLFPVHAHAAQKPSLHLTPSDSELAPEQTYQVDVALKSESEFNLIAGQIAVEYDDHLTLTSIQPSDAIKKDDFRFTLESRSAKGIYASSGQDISLETTFLTLVFTVNEDAEPGPAKVDVILEDLVDDKLQRVPGKLIQSVSLSVTETEVSRAYLEKLVPSDGTLEPSFSPNITEYEMTVPYDVTSLTFDAQTSAGGNVQVNRKTLKAAGTTTTFTITVTADEKMKTVYTVNVHRREKNETSSGKVTEAVASTASLRTSARSSLISASGKTGVPKSASTLKDPNPASSFEEPEPASPLPVSQNQYLSQHTNQMPGFLIWVLCGVAGIILIVLVILLVSQRRKPPEQ